jgi:hypothetical protein
MYSCTPSHSKGTCRPCRPYMGACMSLYGGHACYYMGDMHVSIWGTCMSLYGGHACLYMGDMHVSTWGACMSLYGGHACLHMGDVHVSIWGTCMSLYGGHACYYMGDMHVAIWGTCRSCRLYMEDVQVTLSHSGVCVWGGCAGHVVHGGARGRGGAAGPPAQPDGRPPPPGAYA